MNKDILQFTLTLMCGVLLFASLLSCTPTQQEDPTTKEESSSQPKHRKSPIAIAAVEHQDTYIKIVYGQPYMRGREIFGELVPYGEIWRLGANEATEMTITKPILFGGEKIKAGTYAMFAIPEQTHWQIVINTDLGQWGAFEYDESFDLTRIRVPVEELKKPIEALTISFPDTVEGDQTTLTIAWEYTKVDIPLNFQLK